MIPDRTGRFRERPYYELAELEERSEHAITAFLRERYGFYRILIPEVVGSNPSPQPSNLEFSRT